MKVYSAYSGLWRESSDYLAADKLIKLKNEKPMWDVIDEVITVWFKRQPKQWKAHLFNLSNLKQTRKNKFASTKDKSLRYILDIPEKIIMMIRVLYDTNEAPMDKKWMLKFAKRYPRFLVAEKI